MNESSAQHAIQMHRILPTKTQIDTLYDLLGARKHKISHTGMPDYGVHRSFVENHPYRVWYMVTAKEDALGSIYVGQDNAIGINIVQDITTAALGVLLDQLFSSIEPLPPIASVRAGHFYVNVPTSNQRLTQQLSELGFEATQISFVKRCVSPEAK